MKHCFISGDSFEDDNLVWTPSAGQLVSEHYGYKWSTFAKAGQGNFYILNTILENIKSKDYKLALISWSSINRKDFITAFSNWQVTSSVDATKIKNSHFSLADQIIFENLNYIALAQLIFESLNIPYCMWWSYNDLDQTENKKCLELIEKIKHKKTFFNFESSSYEHAKSIKQIHSYDGKHPNQEAHRRWSLKIIDFINENKK